MGPLTDDSELAAASESFVTNCSFDSTNAQARGTVLPDCNDIEWNSCCAAKILPILGEEAAPYRYGSIILDEGMPVGEPCPQSKEMVRHTLAMEVVDEPSASGSALHPLKEMHDLRIGEVMREQRTDDDVNLSSCIIRQRVADDPFDALGRGSRFPGGTNSVSIEVNSRERDGDTSFRRPPVDVTQRFSVATAHVHDPERTPGCPDYQFVQPGERRTFGKGEAVDSRDVAQTGGQILVAAGLLHHFDQIGALRKIEPWR